MFHFGFDVRESSKFFDTNLYRLGFGCHRGLKNLLNRGRFRGADPEYFTIFFRKLS